jgi:hypothetical protein
MDLSVAAGFFDDQPVYDAYTGDLLYNGQPDLHDLSERDAATGWRRTMSSIDLVESTRGAVRLEEEVFLTGRVVKDFLQGSVVRKYVMLHPADSLVTYGFAENFLTHVITPVSAYAATSWLKDRKFELQGSELYPEYVTFLHPVESPDYSMVILLATGDYLRVQSVSQQTGGLLSVTSFSMGADALQTIAYVAAGAYDVAADSSSASAPVSVPAFIEFFRASYHFVNNAAAKYERADMAVTVSKTSVVLPKTGDTLTDRGVTYRVLEVQDDAHGSWMLHVRPR